MWNDGPLRGRLFPPIDGLRVRSDYKDYVW